MPVLRQDPLRGNPVTRNFLHVALTLSLVLLTALPAGGEDDLLGAARETEAGFTRVIERVRPSVVSILARGAPVEGGGPVRVGGGSGVVIGPKGRVLTNDHVVGWAAELTVIFSGSRRVAAKILGRDPEGDLALLELEGEAPAARVELGDSDGLKLGQWVLAMGNPRGTAMDGRALVTWGTVTSLHALGGGAGRRLFYGDAIQTDAEINPGNSGGPLFDLEGRLIGVNGRIATLSRTASGGVNANVGFAVPASQIRRFLPLLEAGEEIHHGYLGITAETAGEGEVTAAFVVPGSSADRAGIRAGDLLLALDGERIATPARLTNLVSSRPAGQRVAVRVRRGEEERILVARLVPRPEFAR